MKLNFIDLKQQYLNWKDEIDAAIAGVLNSTQFILGPEVAAFEKELAAWCGVKHAVTVGSGTDALLIPLMAMGLKPGDEVITTPFTFFATAEVVALLGAKPVFVDIRKDTYNIDETKIEAAITPRTKGIIPVHLYGQCANLESINAIAKKHNLWVLEDACQALGAQRSGKKTGQWGNTAALSFFPSKNLGCYGDGGAILSDDDALADKFRWLRQHGMDTRYHHPLLGVNGRFDTIQAAIVRVKLKHMDWIVENREKKGAYYSEQLKGAVTVPVIDAGNNHTYGQYTIRTPKREDLIKKLTAQEIPTAVHYPGGLHLQPAFAQLGYKNGDFPQTESASNEVMSLPFFPEITKEQLDMVIAAIKS